MRMGPASSCALTGHADKTAGTYGGRSARTHDVGHGGRGSSKHGRRRCHMIDIKPPHRIGISPEHLPIERLRLVTPTLRGEHRRRTQGTRHTELPWVDGSPYRVRTEDRPPSPRPFRWIDRYRLPLFELIDQRVQHRRIARAEALLVGRPQRKDHVRGIRHPTVGRAEALTTAKQDEDETRPPPHEDGCGNRRRTYSDSGAELRRGTGHVAPPLASRQGIDANHSWGGTSGRP